MRNCELMQRTTNNNKFICTQNKTCLIALSLVNDTNVQFQCDFSSTSSTPAVWCPVTEMTQK